MLDTSTWKSSRSLTVGKENASPWPHSLAPSPHPPTGPRIPHPHRRPAGCPSETQAALCLPPAPSLSHCVPWAHWLHLSGLRFPVCIMGVPARQAPHVAHDGHLVSGISPLPIPNCMSLAGTNGHNLSGLSHRTLFSHGLGAGSPESGWSRAVVPREPPGESPSQPPPDAGRGRCLARSSRPSASASAVLGPSSRVSVSVSLFLVLSGRPTPCDLISTSHICNNPTSK